jgi:DNA repair protein RecN (Recombination protein N)
VLSYISVQNFAIIENIEVDFKKGMTALTGETGAGKSLIIDAIGLLLGDRATSNIVRTGSNKAVVEGLFEIDNTRIIKLLKEYDLFSDNQLLIKRQITQTNNNIIKVNNKTVTLNQLKEITSLLADIHTQFDTHRLINPQTYIEIIDGFNDEKTEKLINDYQLALKEYKIQISDYKKLQKSNDTLYERLDLMKFQVEELESYDLQVDEEEALTLEVEKMENFDSIYKSLNEVKRHFEDAKALDNIYFAQNSLSSVEDFSENYKELNKRINEAYFELVDVSDEINNELSKLDFSPKLLDSHLERLNLLESLKRKYRKSVNEIIEYLEKTKEEIANIDNFDDLVKEQEKKVIDSFNYLLNTSNELTKLRRKTCNFIEKELISILDSLELKKTVFKIEFINNVPSNYTDSSLFLPHGIDEVDFMISTNVGEPMKSLSKSSSGGEMSRIMLGLKNLLVNSLDLSLIIFDEIDTGVSGFVANQVAKKMKEISNNTQVICITHIPQVAALSDNHLYISKSVVNERTRASIKELTGDKRVFEIASMISGEKVSEAAIESAKELLK